MEAEKVWCVEENAWSWCWGGLPWWRRTWGGWHHGKLLGLSQIPGVQEADAHDEPDEPDRPWLGPELLRQQLPAERVHVWLPHELAL